jgi:hypothetical protein
MPILLSACRIDPICADFVKITDVSDIKLQQFGGFVPSKQAALLYNIYRSLLVAK